MTYKEAKKAAERWFEEASTEAVTTRKIRFAYENRDTYVFVEKVPEYDREKEDPTKPRYTFSPVILIIDKTSGTVEYDTFPHAFRYTRGRLIEDTDKTVER